MKSSLLTLLLATLCSSPAIAQVQIGFSGNVGYEYVQFTGREGEDRYLSAPVGYLVGDGSIGYVYAAFGVGWSTTMIQYTDPGIPPDDGYFYDADLMQCFEEETLRAVHPDLCGRPSSTTSEDVGTTPLSLEVGARIPLGSDSTSPTLDVGIGAFYVNPISPIEALYLSALVAIPVMTELAEGDRIDLRLGARVGPAFYLLLQAGVGLRIGL